MLVFKSALLVNRLKESFSFNVCVELNCKYAVVIRTKTERDCAQRAQVVAVVVEKGKKMMVVEATAQRPRQLPDSACQFIFQGTGAPTQWCTIRMLFSSTGPKLEQQHRLK